MWANLPESAAFVRPDMGMDLLLQHDNLGGSVRKTRPLFSVSRQRTPAKRTAREDSVPAGSGTGHIWGDYAFGACESAFGATFRV